jgi:glucose/arabinose dehydrogenase
MKAEQSAPATTTPTPAGWPRIRLEPRWSGLTQPVALTSAGDGSGRLFVCEKAGRIRLIEHGRVLDKPFLDITDRVGDRHMEQGLLSACFPPASAAKEHFYACYTDTRNSVVVSRFDVGGRRGDPGSETRILELWHPYRNHNGGQLAFGPDGCLYVGIGDGGSEYDPNSFGQNPGVALAKILRIDPESAVAPGAGGGTPHRTYRIPPDNPFVGNADFVPETWHWGLRNPWRFSFDRETGDMYIGDVGQDLWEEIDFAEAGRGGLNFGWSLWEGTHYHPADSPRARHSISSLGEQDLVQPVAEYGHREDGGMAVIGGYVYRGARHADLRGVYLYADYGSGRVYGLRRDDSRTWQHETLAETKLAVTSFGEDDDGELYVTDLRGGIHGIEAG